MKGFIRALFRICLGGSLAMFFTIIFIALMVDTLDPSKTDVGLAWAVYSCMWAPIAGVCGCVVGGLIHWRSARSDTT